MTLAIHYTLQEPFIKIGKLFLQKCSSCGNLDFFWETDSTFNEEQIRQLVFLLLRDRKSRMRSDSFSLRIGSKTFSSWLEVFRVAISARSLWRDLKSFPTFFTLKFSILIRSFDGASSVRFQNKWVYFKTSQIWKQTEIIQISRNVFYGKIDHDACLTKKIFWSCLETFLFLRASAGSPARQFFLVKNFRFLGKQQNGAGTFRSATTRKDSPSYMT